MSASLVGSEMCIRDSAMAGRPGCWPRAGPLPCWRAGPLAQLRSRPLPTACLLYTSDAADDM
eukprot:6138198-Alexandrium_andersonii.AAC.1